MYWFSLLLICLLSIYRLYNQIIHREGAVPPFFGNSSLEQLDLFLQFACIYDNCHLSVRIGILIITKENFLNIILAISGSPVDGSPCTVCRLKAYSPLVGGVEKDTCHSPRFAEMVFTGINRQRQFKFVWLLTSSKSKQSHNERQTLPDHFRNHIAHILHYQVHS